MSIYKAKVIVLKQQCFGESDLIIRALNSQGSLISFIAKGAKKSRRRFIGGVLEIGNFIGVEYKFSKKSYLHFLQEAWFLKRFNELRKDYERLKLAFYFLSLLEKISQEGVEDSFDLFNLLGNSLTALETSHNLLALQFLFEFRLLLIQGVLSPELQKYTPLCHLTITEHEKLSQYMPTFKNLTSQVQQEVNQYVCGR